MNKILFNFILGIIVAVNMLFFPVQAEEVPISDAQTAVEDLHDEESSDDPVEESVIENDSETASENVTIDEGVSSDQTENEAGTEDLTEEETGIADAIAIEEESGTKDATEEETGTEDETEEENGAGDAIEEGTENGETAEEDLTAEGNEEVAADGESNEIEEVQQEDPSDGVTETIPDDSENPSAGTAEAILDDPEVLTETQTPANDSGVNVKPEKADPAPPVVVYARPVISSISTDGTSITLKWDNPEGALFRIYRWNILPYQIGTSSTGSFVDKDVSYGWSYTYFIATDSPAFRYPYSQTVSKRVSRPIEDIDQEHKIGENLSWNLDGDKKQDSLVISGSGSMPDFSSPSEIPWRDRAGEIKQIAIDDGVTYVGDHTFSDMESLEEVSLPSSVREYGHEVFRGSTNLEFFNHDSAVDSDQLHIAVQYLTGVYSGEKFEPEVNVRKGAEGKDYNGMPALVPDRDYTVTYNNTTEAGDGTIEITFIGDYADAGSVVIPFTVVSELREGEKIKNITGIELLPSSGTYTGLAHHPDTIVRSGRWTLKEGVDYILTYTDMIEEGTYTVTAQGIGAYSGEAQALYTIRNQKQSGDSHPPVIPPAPNKTPVPDKIPAPDTPKTPDTIDPDQQEPVKKPEESNGEKAGTKDAETEAAAEKGKEEIADAAAETENEETADAAAEYEEETADAASEAEREEMALALAESEREDTAEAEAESEEEETAEPVTDQLKEKAAKAIAEKFDSFLSDLESFLEENFFGKVDFSPGESLGKKDLENVKLFAGVVGIVISICAGVYIWFFHWFLHGM